MPIWEQPLGIGELKSLLAEGRAQVGKEQAARPIDMARAIASLGVAKGITSFQRFAYLERNGQARLAVPLSRVSVTERPRARLVDDLAGWMVRLQRLCHDKGSPGRIALVERVLSDAVFDALTHDDTPGRWQAVLKAAVAVEQLQAVGTAIKAGPIPRLTPEWVAACDDGSPEFRLALALGSASAGRRQDPLRHHWLPLKPGAQAFNKNDDRLAHDVRVVAHGREAVADLLAVLVRRCIEGEKQSRHPAIIAGWGTEATLPDLAAWVAGEVDVAHCLSLARAFMALDWQRWDAKKHGYKHAGLGDARPPEAWMQLRLCALPWPIGERDIAMDPGILLRLEVGDLDGALHIAAHRLQAHGIRPLVKNVLGGGALARLWGSALAFPVSQATAATLIETLQPQNKELSHAR
jgi:CRISPR-associated protein Csx17